ASRARTVGDAHPDLIEVGVEHVAAVVRRLLPALDQGLGETATREARRVELPGNALGDDAVFIAARRGPLPRLLAVGSVAKLALACHVLRELPRRLPELGIGPQTAAPLLLTKTVGSLDDQLLH